MNEVMINNLKKSFSGKFSLAIPRFTAGQSEIISVLGTNGSGKSTFIKLISGLLLQDEGSVMVCGYANSSKKIHQLTKFVLESGRGYYEYLTAQQNIDYFLRLNQLSTKQVSSEMKRLFAIFDFKRHADTLVSDLSQGTRQKLSLIVALLCQPRVLCLDEPTNGLDVLAKKQLANLLFELSSQRGVIVFLTTHDILFAKEISTRILIMKDGQIRKEGSFQELFAYQQDWKKFVFKLAPSSESLLKQCPDKITYEMIDEQIVVKTKSKAAKDWLLRECDVLQFEEHEQNIEAILAEVLS